MKTARSAILSLFLAVSLSDAQADWRVEAETGSFYESDISNSNRASDEQDDWAWRSDVRVGNSLQLSRNLNLRLAADVRGQVWDEFDALDAIGGGGSLDLRYRFGLGREAPWLLLEQRAGYDRFDETARSSWDESLRLRGGIAVSDRIALEAGYRFENIAASADFFSLQGHSGDARVIVELTSALQIALSYTYRDGEVISYAVPPRPDILLLTSESRPVTTFGTSPLYTAYRFRGQTHGVSVSAACAVTKDLSVQVAYEYAATSHDPLRYENHSVEVKIAFAY